MFHGLPGHGGVDASLQDVLGMSIHHPTGSWMDPGRVDQFYPSGSTGLYVQGNRETSRRSPGK